MLIRVPGVGNPNADIMIVGEAPGEQEVRARKPFVGFAGHRLDVWLATAGIRRKDCWVTNIVKVRPPANKYDRLPELGVTEADFIPELVQEIKRVQPKVIVALGNQPMRVLTGHDTGILKRRGSFYPCTLVSGSEIQVLVTIHPAARVLPQRPELDSICAADLRKAKEFIDRGFHIQEPDKILNPTFERAMEWLDHAPDPLAVDIEYIHGRTTCIGLGNNYTILVLPITHSSGEAFWTEDHEVQFWLKLQELWKTRNLIGQNFSFDMAMLHQWLGFPEHFFFDTMVAHSALYPGWKHDLATLTSIYTTMPYYKEEVKDWSGRISNETLWAYNAKDIQATYLCYMALRDELEEEGLSDFYTQHLHPTILPYLEMSLRGVRIDLERKQKRSKELLEQIKEGEALLSQLCGHELNVASPKQVSELLYKELGIKGKGTDKKQLKRLEARYAGTPIGAIVSAVNRIRHLRKLRSSYFEAPVSEDVRWRTRYSVSVTLSGRLSASKWLDGTGVNLQTLPPEARELVIPDPGMVLVEIDLSQAEARVVAWEGEDEGLKEFFRSGQDVHSLIAEALGVPRKTAKATVHGSNYGMGKYLFSEHVGLPVSKASEIQEQYFRKFPGVRRRMWRVDQRLQRREPYFNPFGRRLVSFGMVTSETKRSWYSWFPQSTVGDIIHQAVVKLSKDPRITLLLNVHDSILFECKPEDLDYAIKTVKSAMEVPLTIGGDSLTIPADVEVFQDHWEKR